MQHLLAHLPAALVLSICSLPCFADALLHCDVDYGGQRHVVESAPVDDPYAVPAIDIDGRFKFKAVMLGRGAQVDYIKLYAYYQGRERDLPIHQASYFPPFQTTLQPYRLTPQNSLYAGLVERELQYACTLQGVQP